MPTGTWVSLHHKWQHSSAYICSYSFYKLKQLLVRGTSHQKQNISFYFCFLFLIHVVSHGMHNQFACTSLLGSDIYLHRDKNFMPKNPAAWSAWNFLGSAESKVCLTYWLNLLQVCCFLHFYRILVPLLFRCTGSIGEVRCLLKPMDHQLFWDALH